MNLEYMNTLLALVRLGSFSAVAKEQGLTQPAVSFQIQKLEQDLNVRLLNRTSRQLSLTDAGKLVTKFAENTELNYQALLRDLDMIREDLVGDLVISSSSTPGEYIVPSILGKFLSNHPAIKSHVVIKNSQDVIDGVRNGDFEIGFCGSLPANCNDLNYIKIGSDRIKLIVNPNHPFAKKSSISFSMLLNEPIISREASSGTRQSLEKMIKSAGYNYENLNHRLVLGSARALISAVEAGSGVAFVSSYALMDSKRAGTIKTVKISDIDLTRYFYCIHLKEKINSRLVSEFVDFVKSNVLEEI